MAMFCGAHGERRQLKHHGCILEFTQQRNNELMRAFKQAVAGCAFINITSVARAVVDSPCSRFWVSEERALAVVSALLKGKPALDNMRQSKREMFQEIFRRVSNLRKLRPHNSLTTLVAEAVHSPAPKFYMRPRCAMEIIYKIKKGHYDTRHNH